MRKIISIVGAILISISLLGQQDLITQGDSAYNSEMYTEAISNYEAVLDQGFESAQLYYNLGNAYFNINMLPAAILNYERAKVLAPADADIDFNLNIANSMIPDKIEPVPEIFYIRWWKSLRNSFNLYTWTIASISIFVMLILCAGIFFLSRNILMRKFAFWSGIFFILFSIAGFSMTYTRYDIQSKHLEAIVFDPTITVKSSPNQLGKDLFVIHEGTKVFILEEINEWCNIKIANGSAGWLPATSIKRI
ncbi:MAG: tetratricopeptide repeat protein [Bacteroidetes bacterium]|nr:tetratricopeptide repeat protein [Bacteroidota bacterium]MCK5765133.1 tetratricopeptide repeat protein [Bacteroidales bacterium]